MSDVQTNPCFKIIPKLISFYNIIKIIVNDYDSNIFFHKFKTIVINYGFNFLKKLKIIVINYYFDDV